MNKSLKKDTILKLLSSMSSEKEIRKYLESFRPMTIGLQLLR
jgi:hypothetical protein